MNLETVEKESSDSDTQQHIAETSIDGIAEPDERPTNAGSEAAGFEHMYSAPLKTPSSSKSSGLKHHKFAVKGDPKESTVSPNNEPFANIRSGAAGVQHMYSAPLKTPGSSKSSDLKHHKFAVKGDLKESTVSPTEEPSANIKSEAAEVQHMNPTPLKVPGSSKFSGLKQHEYAVKGDPRKSTVSPEQIEIAGVEFEPYEGDENVKGHKSNHYVDYDEDHYNESIYSPGSGEYDITHDQEDEKTRRKREREEKKELKRLERQKWPVLALPKKISVSFFAGSGMTLFLAVLAAVLFSVLLSGLMDDYSDVKNDSEALEENFTNLSTILNKSGILQFPGKVDELERNISSANNSINQLRNGSDSLNSSITKIQNDIKELNSTLETTSFNLTTLQIDIKNNHNEITRLNSSLVLAENNLTLIAEEINSLNATVMCAEDPNCPK